MGQFDSEQTDICGLLFHISVGLFTAELLMGAVLMLHNSHSKLHVIILLLQYMALIYLSSRAICVWLRMQCSKIVVCVLL